MATELTERDMQDIRNLLDNCDNLSKELDERKRCLDFLINEYRTNKKWFRDKPGRVTVEDVIAACFDFGWSSRRNFEVGLKKKRS